MDKATLAQLRKSTESVSSAQDVPIFGLLVIALLLSAECYAWFVVPSWILTWGLHTGAVCCLWGLCRLAAKKDWDERIPKFALILCLAIGPFGLGVAFLSALLYRIFRHFTSCVQLLEELYPDFEEHAINEVALRIRGGRDKVGKDTTPVPFRDIMTFGTVIQKRKVISLIMRYFSPDLVEILQMGLRDGDNSVRVMAATTFVAIEDQFYSGYLMAKKRLREDPKDPEAVLAFAKQCCEYGLSKILEGERANSLCQQAIEAFERYTSLKGKTDKVSMSLARLYHQQGRLEECKRVLDPLVENQKELGTDLSELYGHVLFSLGDYQGLRQLAAKINMEGDVVGLDTQRVVNNLFLWRPHQQLLEEALAK